MASGLETAGFAIQISRLVNETALGLYQFLREVRSAGESARRMQHALVSLKKTIDKIHTLFAFPRPFDEQERSLHKAIRDILACINRDVEALSDKLKIKEILQKEGNWFETALELFKRSFNEAEIKEINERLDKYERLVQTHFEMSLLLSSWKAHSKLDDISGVVQQIYSRLINDAETAKSIRRTSNATTCFETRPDIYLGLWQTHHTEVIESVICGVPPDADDIRSNVSGSSQRGWVTAPSVLDDPAGPSGRPTPELTESAWPPAERQELTPPMLPVHTGRRRTSVEVPVVRSQFERRLSKVDKPETNRTSKGELERKLRLYEQRVGQKMEAEDFPEAEEYQGMAIGIRRELQELSDGAPFPFEEEFEMEKQRAEIFLRMGTDKGQEAAYAIIASLLQKEQSLGEERSIVRRSQLYYTLVGIELGVGSFKEAILSAMCAAKCRLELSDLALEDQTFLRNIASMIRDTATKVPDETWKDLEGDAIVALDLISEKLGNPPVPWIRPSTMEAISVMEATSVMDVTESGGDLDSEGAQQEDSGAVGPSPQQRPEYVPDEEGTFEWCHRQGFRLGRDFKYHLIDPGATGAAKGLSPIHLAIKTGATYQLKTMVYRDPNIRLPGKSLPNAPLLLACAEGNTEAVKALLDLGARVDVKDDEGLNGLHHCQNAKGSGEKVASLLLEHKSAYPLNIDDHNVYGRAAIHMAALHGKYDFLEFLLRNRANPNAQTKYEGRTPLLVVLFEKENELSQTKYENVIKALLAWNADLTIQSHHQSKTVQKNLEILQKRVKLAKSKGKQRSRQASTAPTFSSDSSTPLPPICTCFGCAVHSRIQVEDQSGPLGRKPSTSTGDTSTPKTPTTPSSQRSKRLKLWRK